VVEIGATGLNVGQQLTQPSSILDPKPALSFIAICANDRKIASLSVRTDHNGLILD
jgi:hypothetical protein